jgi:MYXO-CTERM domain-containing protein
VLSYPAAGAPRLLPEEAQVGRINDAGQIAVQVRPDGQPAQVIRWQKGTAQRLLSVHTTIGDGATFIGGGLEAVCLADDGRVAHLAQGTNGTSGWLCEDASGTHLLATTSNPPISYGRVAHCEFAGADQIVVLDGGHVSRLGRGAGKVLSVGDRLADGSAVTYIQSVSANADATLVAVVWTGGDRVLLRQDRGGAVDRVAIRLPGDVPPIEVDAAGIGADGTIAAFVYRDTGVATLVAVRDGVTRVLTDFDKFTILSALWVRGDYAVVSTATATGTQVFRFTLSTAEGGPILQPDLAADPFVVDLNRSGDVLFRTSDVLDFSAPHTNWRWHASVVEELSHVETPFDASNDPVAFNDAGNVLTFAPGAYAGARYRLSLSGPAASAACPGTAANSSSADSNGCQVAPTGRASWWPLVFALGLAAARRRRGGAGTEARAPTGTS